MKKLALALVLGLAAACNPSITSTPEPTNQIQAQFNPGASPPVLPVPTDLAVNPANGRLNIPVDDYPNPVDQSFVVYLDSLTGYPSDTPASATVSGSLNGSTVVAGSTVLTIDETGGNFQQVSGVTVSYTDTPQSLTSAGTIGIAPPPGGWLAGHTYDFALTDGIQGANGEVLVGTPQWLLVRSTGSLVSCPAPFTSTSCAPTTSLIPTAADAIALEQVRLEYQPVLKYLDGTSTPRAHIPLLWRFTCNGGVTMDFDSTGPSCPPNVPSPTNLAINPGTGLVNAPICSTYTPAQQEFTADYLNTLNGFPTIATATAPVINGDLDPTTVTNFSVITLDITQLGLDGGDVFAVSPSGYLYAPGTDGGAFSGQLTVLPPDGGWTKGETYAVGVLTGLSGGVTDTSGNPISSNDAFALIENPNPLALCPDGGSPDPLGAFTCPSQLTVASLSDAQASQAEVVREQLAPVLAALQTAGGVASIQPSEANPDGGQPVIVGGIAMAWTFTITSQAEVQFNLAATPTDGGASAAVVPFPNDLLFLGSQADGGHVCLAATLDGACLDQSSPAVIQAIDSLDGFSLTAPAVVVNNGSLDALDTLTDGVHVLQAVLVDGGAPVPVGTANTVVLDGGASIPVGSATPAYVPAPAGLINLGTGAAALTQACVNCDNTPNPDSGAFASDSLQILPSVPLVEDTPYAGYVQTALLGDNNLPVAPALLFALVRLSNPLVDANGNATVSGLSDAQAQQLEPIRQSYKPMFDALDAMGMPRSTLAMAWTYHTQTDVKTLAYLYGLSNPAEGVAGVVPASVPEFTMPLDGGIEQQMFTDAGISALFPSRAEYVLPIDAAFKETLADGGSLAFGLDPAPHSHIEHFVAGAYYSANVQGPLGTIDPDPTQWQTTRIPFLLSLPNPAATPAGVTPANGWPVVIFGHGVTRSRIDMLALADSFAQIGFAVIAEDIIDHGDRSICAGVAAAGDAFEAPDGGTFTPTSDDEVCHNKGAEKCDESATSPTFGKCIGRSAGSNLPCGNPRSISTLFPPGASGDLLCTLERQGSCNETSPNPSSWHCYGGDFLREESDNVAAQPVISGWNIFSLSNLFQTRDTLRQQMVDLGQIENVLVNGNTELNEELAEWGLDPLDGTQIHYVGQSLGGILGTEFTAVSTNVQHSVLNVAGGGFVQILRTSPAFAPTYQAFQAAYAAQGITAGMAAFDTLVHSAEWILDDTDPRVSAEYLAGYAGIEGGTAPANREVLGLYIAGDEVVTTPAEQAENFCAENSPVATNPFVTLEFVPTSTTTDPTGATLGLDLGDRHGFLLNFVNPVLTTEAQFDASTFILNGSLPTGTGQ